MEGRREKEEAGRKHHFKGTAKAVHLAQKLSPKAQRKKDKNDQVAQLKVLYKRQFKEKLHPIYKCVLLSYKNWKCYRSICCLVDNCIVALGEFYFCNRVQFCGTLVISSKCQ